MGAAAEIGGYMLTSVESMLYTYKADLVTVADLTLEIQEAKSPRLGCPGYGERSSGGERRDIIDDIIRADERVGRLQRKMDRVLERIAPVDTALRAMEGTPERTVIWMLYMRGLRVSEVSRILGISRNMVESRRRRGLVMVAGYAQSKRTPQVTKN